MEAQKTRLHPLVAGAAAAVIVAAGVAVAAITGVLPGSKAEMAPTPEVKSTQPAKTHVASTQTAQHKPVPVCHDCGVIVEVKEVDVLGKGTGIGAVVGHQIGDNRAGTAVGAVVGAVAGHQIERKAREHKKYEITVRMNDGSVRSLSDESGTPIALRSGDKVHVSKEGVIRPI